MRSVKLGLMLATVMAAVPAAAAAQSASYGGGRLAAEDTPQNVYKPGLGITLQPRGDQLAIRFDTSLLCGGKDPYLNVTGRRVVGWDGRSFRARGRSSFELDVGRIVYTWQLQGRVDGPVATGALRITGAERGSRHRAQCRAKPVRRFEARVPGDPVGPPALPRAGAAYVGLSDHLIGGLPAPVVLRGTRDGRSVSARWTVAAPCDDEDHELFTNYTPPTKVQPDGSFRRAERFKFRYSDALVRFRVLFTGRFTGTGASGTLELRARTYPPRGGRVRRSCATGTHHWSAALAGPVAAP